MEGKFDGHTQLVRVDQHLAKVLKNFQDENAWFEFALFCAEKLSDEKKLQLIDTIKARLPQQCAVCGKEITVIEWINTYDPKHFHVTCKDHLEAAGVFDVWLYKIEKGLIKL